MSQFLLLFKVCFLHFVRYAILAIASSSMSCMALKYSRHQDSANCQTAPRSQLCIVVDLILTSAHHPLRSINCLCFSTLAKSHKCLHIIGILLGCSIVLGVHRCVVHIISVLLIDEIVGVCRIKIHNWRHLSIWWHLPKRMWHGVLCDVWWRWWRGRRRRRCRRVRY